MAARGVRTDPASRGQATIEYVGAVLLVAVLLLALIAFAGLRPPGLALVRTVLNALVCAVDDGACDGAAPPASAIEATYGAEIATLLARHTPDVFFERDDFVSLPVDFRRCRERRCADTITGGAVHLSQTGERPVAFTHVVDCRGPGPAQGDPDCSGGEGNLYLQYWLYYPESLTRGLGRFGGFHEDDWESLQVRIGPGGEIAARASSHHGYNGSSGGLGSVASDTGLRPRPAWEPWSGALHVAAGSHAGTTTPAIGDSRAIHGDDILLVPAEPVAATSRERFAVTPPWRKEVWDFPEAMGT